MNIAVLVSGGGTNLQAIIDRINEGAMPQVNLVKVISSNPEAYALYRAKQHQIPCSVIAKKAFSDVQAYDEAMLSELTDASVDLVVLAGFLSLLGPKVVSTFSNRIINIHPSLIPSFCGKGMYGIRPHEAALARGVKISGATVHFVNESYDEGPILLQKSAEIYDDDTPQTLQQRIMLTCEQDLLPRAIQLIADNKVIIENNRAFIITKGSKEGLL